MRLLGRLRAARLVRHRAGALPPGLAALLLDLPAFRLGRRRAAAGRCLRRLRRGNRGETDAGQRGGCRQQSIFVACRSLDVLSCSPSVDCLPGLSRQRSTQAPTRSNIHVPNLRVCTHATFGSAISFPAFLFMCHLPHRHSAGTFGTVHWRADVICSTPRIRRRTEWIGIEVEGNWKETKGKIKEKWGQLTDDDLAQVNGQRDQLEGKIQQRYGLAKDMVRKDVDAWLKATEPRSALSAGVSGGLSPRRCTLLVAIRRLSQIRRNSLFCCASGKLRNCQQASNR